MTSIQTDRAKWAEEQAGFLRKRNLRAIDRNEVSRVVENLGVADIDQIRERVRILVTGLLRWAYEVDHRSIGLYSTIMQQRHLIADLLEESPSLVPVATKLVVETYPQARRAAGMEYGPFEDMYPAGLPFLPTEVFDHNFLPDPYGDDEIRGADWWRPR